ncbi:MAG: T9SS type A sorting domain-containing protein [Bacteroidetes bacterium]|nr:T9SS type A sorting domain-containing protein [Bacteroidota bacterium]
MKALRIFTLMLMSLLCAQLLAQVKYVDIKPDVKLEGVHHMPMDLDSNGTTDFILLHDTLLANWPNEGAQINVIHHMGVNEIVGQESGHFYPKPLSFNTLLFEGSKSWGIFEDNLALYVWVVTNGVLSHHGLWRYLSDDRFVGFRMQSDQGRLYGWIRLFVSPDGKYMILRDYAYQEIPEEPMYTGEGIPVNPIKNLSVQDVFDFGDGRDLQVTFSPQVDEIAISHYRILIIKSSDLTHFDLLAAINVPASSCTKVYPSPNPYSMFLNADTRDVSGELIKAGEEYVIKVLSVGRKIDNPEYSLSPATNPFSLDKLTTMREENGQSISVHVADNHCIITSADSKFLGVQLYNLNGQLLKNSSVESNAYHIDLSCIRADIVVLIIQTEKSIITRKLNLN